MADKQQHKTLELKLQHKTLELSVRQGSDTVTMDVTALPVRATRHAETAERLETPRRIAVAGDVLGDTLFDGSEDVVIGTAVECISTLEIDALMESAMMLGG